MSRTDQQIVTAQRQTIDSLRAELASAQKLKPPDDHVVVPADILRTILSRLHQLATDGLALDRGAVGQDDDGAESCDGVETCAPGVWVHDTEMPHPCEYACGAVYIERADRQVGEDVEPTFRVEVGTWRFEL